MYVSEPLTFLVLAKGTDLKFIIHNYIYLYILIVHCGTVLESTIGLFSRILARKCQKCNHIVIK